MLNNLITENTKYRKNYTEKIQKVQITVKYKICKIKNTENKTMKTLVYNQIPHTGDTQSLNV